MSYHVLSFVIIVIMIIIIVIIIIIISSSIITTITVVTIIAVGIVANLGTRIDDTNRKDILTQKKKTIDP